MFPDPAPPYNLTAETLNETTALLRHTAQPSLQLFSFRVIGHEEKQATFGNTPGLKKNNLHKSNERHCF